MCGEPVPAGSSCCAPVESRRLSSEAAPRAPVPGGGGAGLVATVPGERLRTNESERGQGCACPGPASHHSRKEGHTGREGGREEKHRVTERQMDEEPITDLRTEPRDTETRWTANRSGDQARPGVDTCSRPSHGHSPSRHSPAGSEPQD